MLKASDTKSRSLCYLKAQLLYFLLFSVPRLQTSLYLQDQFILKFCSRDCQFKAFWGKSLIRPPVTAASRCQSSGALGFQFIQLYIAPSSPQGSCCVISGKDRFPMSHGVTGKPRESSVYRFSGFPRCPSFCCLHPWPS
jgi:hypothetical protein